MFKRELKKNPMKRSIFAACLVMLLLIGCGKAAPEERGPFPVRKDGGAVRSGLSDAASGRDDVIGSYPGSLPDEAAWTEYPGDNIFGLRAVAGYSEKQSDFLILAFESLNASGFNDSIIRNSDYLTGYCPYGSFDFDDTELLEQGDYYYLKLSCDSRIDLKLVSFSKGDERCNIDIKDGIALTYCDFRNLEKTKRIRQSYDPKQAAWVEAGIEESDETPVASCDPSVHTELAVDCNEYEPSSTLGNVTFSAYNYRYSTERYNIYGETDQPQLTSLFFFLAGEDSTPDEESSFSLYVKDKNGYKEITPRDCQIVVTPDDVHNRLMLEMQSNLLGELTEGDYRAEYGKYSLDFRLSVQTYEVW